jgi:16S rRNA (guanine(527)-N(7))-methyltransferase RsmG
MSMKIGGEEQSIAGWLEMESARIHVPVSSQCLEAVARFDALLLRWNKIVNLTRLSDVRERAQFLYLESFWGAMRCPIEGTLFDLGSGCGFPGIAFKWTYPQTRVVLVESRAKKSHFLKEVIRELGLEGTEVFNERIEKIPRMPGLGIRHFSWRAVSIGEENLRALGSMLPMDGSLIFFGTARSGDLRELMSQPGLRCELRESFPAGRERILIRLGKCST